MLTKSHVDFNKVNKVPHDHPFEYRDVVSDSFPDSEHTEDGKIFKDEVDTGVFKSIIVDKETDNRVLYRKK